ncbi:hypothetical protein [Escherichia phage vB_EcoM_ULIM3]|uniref:Uncharacterized protein n=1 Tax=Escherichia phage vB_EcoM_LMP25 TaxID=2491663 RepID=A0A482MQP2_9CAUD|nr:hypothetical protein [Escherichia phage vB_EcoM_LMP33]QBQ76301.1 hypothetical protein [Escherichia phage vB_EcoM_LMP25]WPJ69757.1 hypothetical protein [Escherichia phage vB_EcoM_ULIM3]WPJ69795.1 hypothetical protein [Escherichia phage vB_EcoM_ULIM8]
MFCFVVVVCARFITVLPKIFLKFFLDSLNVVI